MRTKSRDGLAVGVVPVAGSGVARIVVGVAESTFLSGGERSCEPLLAGFRLYFAVKANKDSVVLLSTRGNRSTYLPQSLSNRCISQAALLIMMTNYPSALRRLFRIDSRKRNLPQHTKLNCLYVLSMYLRAISHFS